jgi:GDPmannose 4,6-dehydratase
MKTALITGITGQDGSYLSELLLDKGYKVIGILRRHSVAEKQTFRIDHIMDNENLILEYGDLLDIGSLISLINQYQPDELYHLAAQSHVGISFKQPIFTSEVTAMGTMNVLEAVRLSGSKCKVYNAGSSEMFGNQIDDDGFQRETTKMIPVSPYGCSKVFSYNLCHNYRNAYDMFICSGILFNHESPRRGLNFVTNKVAKGAVEIYYGIKDKLHLGNLNASRDWGHSKDYVNAMWMMLQEEYPDDYVCATGISHSIKDLCEVVFNQLDMKWEDYVVSDQKFMRAEELEFLKGDSTKLRTKLNWTPEYTFESMMNEMVSFWLDELKPVSKRSV